MRQGIPKVSFYMLCLQHLHYAYITDVESYTATGDRWQAGSSDIYRGECDLINDHNALDTLKDAKMPTTQYIISDIRGSIEQLTGINGKKTRTFTYSAFGEELSGMLLDDIHVASERYPSANVSERFLP